MSLIAIVEHEALVALDIAKTLQRAGYETAGPFGDGRKYLDSLKKGRSYDLVLVDISIEGGVSGAEAAFVSRTQAGIPCVLISALSDSSVLPETMNAEPLGILVKPFSERELLGTTEIALFRAGMERKLSYSEKRYRELFGLSLSPRCVSDADGKILEMNGSFKKVFASPDPAPALGSFFTMKEEWKNARDSVLAGRTVLGEEFEMADTGGRRLSILASFSAFNEEGSGSPMISAEFFDLTEAHRLRDELLQSQKMDAMGRLAGGIAHDFNNILTAIIGHAEMLKLDIKPQDPSFEDVEGIAKTASRATQLTKQLLGFSRKQPYSPKPIGLASIVRDTSGILRKLAGESILFSAALPATDPIVFADPIQIEQALINLVVNARDALEGKSGARISVLVEEKQLAETTKIGANALAPGGYATIEVLDNGSGIPADLVDKIFDPFFTTKETGKGTGLGLAIVSSIAAQTKGAIGLQSVVGKGTVFTLWLPTAPEKGRSELFPSDRATQLLKEGQDLSLSGNPGVLLVDDDESLLGFLSSILYKAGASVISARNAGEAMLQAEKNDFDILVADINLPGLDGLGLYARLAAKLPGHAEKPLKCVFISGRIEATMNIPEGMKLLEKPFTPWELISAIRAALS
ncbi:MAG TPA: response regulator [Rectinemataceae bacterium]|nr:response regulator [Rectinemataceae bacterium]